MLGAIFLGALGCAVIRGDLFAERSKAMYIVEESEHIISLRWSSMVVTSIYNNIERTISQSL
jgi:hypothetical protein